MTDREMLEMLVEGQRQIFGRLDGIDTRLDKVDTRLDGIDTRLDKVDARLDGIDARLDKVDARLDRIDEELSSMKNRLDILTERHRLLEKKFDRMINFDFKQMQDTLDTIVTLLQIREIIPERSIRI